MLRIALSMAMVSFGGPAFADCVPFTLTSDPSTRTVQHVDAGHGGLGDLRIGQRLVYQDGELRGEKHWVGMILGTGPDAPALFNRVWRLDDGDIHARQMTGTISLPQDTSRPSIGDGDAVILGGSGDYTGASGTVRVDLEGTSVTYIFEIDCQ